MRVLVMVSVVAAVALLAACLQALAGLAQELPLEPRAGRSRSVLRVTSHALPRSGSGGWARRARGAPSAGPDDLRQLEALAERALAGEATAVDVLARRTALVAEACALPAALVPAAAHRSVPELRRALDRVDEALGRTKPATG
jgi:hypothetical protein